MAETAVRNARLTLVAQIVLSAAALGSIMLYWSPSETCIQTPTCGEWMTNYVPPPVAKGVMMSGGLDFALISAYMAFYAIRELKEYVERQSSRGQKIAKAGLVTFFALSQNTRLLLLTLTTSKFWWESTITVIAGIPAAFYSATGLMKNDIPTVYDYLKTHTRPLQKSVNSLFFKPSQIELEAKKREIDYRAQQVAFNKKITAKLAHLVRNQQDFPAVDVQDSLVFLASQAGEYTPSQFRQITTQGLGVLGGMIGAYFASFLAKNTHSNLSSFIPYDALTALLAIYLAITLYYPHVRIMAEGASDLSNRVFDFADRKSSQALQAEFRPIITHCIDGLALLLSVFSYAVMSNVYNAEITPAMVPDNQTREALGYAADTGMNLYHFFGILHFWSIIYSHLNKAGAEKTLNQFQHDVKQVTRLRSDQFIQFVENNSAERNEQLGLHVIEEPVPVESLITPMDEETALLGAKRKSAWSGLFSCCAREPKGLLKFSSPMVN